MTPAPHPLDDPTVERLIRRAGAADGHTDVPADLEPVARFLSAVADLGDTPAQPRGALAALLVDGFVHTPAHAAPTPLRRRLVRLRGPLARLAGVSLVAQVLTGTGVAVASVTAAAGAGVLPASLQTPVSEVLNVVTPFTFPSAPAAEPAPESEPQGPAAPAGGTQPAPAETEEQATTADATVEPAPTPSETAASADPTTTPSASAPAQPSPSPTGTPAPSPSDTGTPSPVPEPTSPTELPTTEPTTSPSPTAEPTTSGRPTRQNEDKDKADGDTTVVVPADDPALVAVD